MSLGTLTFEIEADASGVDDATTAVEERLQAIEEQLEATTEAAEEANEKLGNIGSKMNIGMAVKAVKLAAHAVKELGAFVIESARSAAEAGNGPMKKFVGNIDQLHSAFQKVGAQAASQLAPVLQQITDHFTHSTEAAHALKEAGTFIANVFRVVASVGIAVVAVFDAVGTAIAGVASMIVDVLSGNMGAAAESWKVLGDEMGKVLDRASERFTAVWQQGQDFAGEIPVAGKKKTGMSGEEKVQIAESNFANEKVAIEEIVDAKKKEVDAIGDVNKQQELAERGYANVNEALAAFEESSKTAAEERYKAVQAEAEGRFMEAEQLKMSAQIHEEAAEKVMGSAESLKKKLENDVNTIDGALAAFANGVLKAIPRLNELVSAAQQGAAVGGIWGALIAVLLQLISETEGFSKVIDVVNGDLDQLLDALGPLVASISSLMEAVDPLTTIITALVRVALIPVVAIIQGLSLAVEWVIIGFMKFGEWINNLNAFRPQADKDAQAAQIRAREEAAHQKARDAEASLKGMWDDSVNEWKGAVDPHAENKEEKDAKDALDDFTKSAIAATEALANVPSGYKVAVARFEQQQAVGTMTMQMITGELLGALLGALSIPHMAAGGIVTAPTLALIGEAGPEAVVPLDGSMGGGMNFYGDVIVVASDPETMGRKLRKKMFARKGTGFPGEVDDVAEYMTINGITIPCLVDGASHETQLLLDSERAESMALIENVEAEKGTWQHKLVPQTRANAFAFRELINGKGHYWSFDDTAGGGGTAGLYSSSGLGPTGAITGVTLGGAAPAPWLGAGRVQITTGNSLVYTLGAGLPGLTVMVARSVNGAAWEHIIKDDGGTVYTNGVVAGAAATVGITLATGVVTLDTAGGVSYQYDELVILPFRLVSGWQAQAYAFQNPAGGNTQWSKLRQLKLQGDCLPEGGTKIVAGRITRENVQPQVIGTFQPSARDLEFELVEV